jgi:2-dehydropantoate 2-reductase
VWKAAPVRFIVYGAGAVGGIVGGRLAQHRHDVVLIARGAHAEALRRSGLTIESPSATTTVDVPVATHPSELELGPDDIVLLAMKSQDTHEALLALRAAAPASLPVVCLQNGVENERAALRLFERVYGINVMCPAGHLEPGVVQAYSSPLSGILALGLDVRLGGARRHHALEVREAAHEPRQRGAGAVRARSGARPAR